MSAPEELLQKGPVLLYDGSCGVCNQTVQWVLAHERSDSKLRFAALESPAGIALRGAAQVPSDVDSLLWIESDNGKVRALIRSSAALRVASEARGAWRLLGLFRVVPRFIRDFCYDAFARIRHHVIAPACL